MYTSSSTLRYEVFERRRCIPCAAASTSTSASGGVAPTNPVLERLLVVVVVVVLDAPAPSSTSNKTRLRRFTATGVVPLTVAERRGAEWNGVDSGVSCTVVVVVVAAAAAADTATDGRTYGTRTTCGVAASPGDAATVPAPTARRRGSAGTANGFNDDADVADALVVFAIVVAVAVAVAAANATPDDEEETEGIVIVRTRRCEAGFARLIEKWFSRTTLDLSTCKLSSVAARRNVWPSPVAVVAVVVVDAPPPKRTPN